MPIDVTMQHATSTRIARLLVDQASASLPSEGPLFRLDPKPGLAPPGSRPLLFSFLDAERRQGLGDVKVDARRAGLTLRLRLTRAGFRLEWASENLGIDARIRMLIQ